MNDIPNRIVHLNSQVDCKTTVKQRKNIVTVGQSFTNTVFMQWVHRTLSDEDEQFPLHIFFMIKKEPIILHSVNL